jgi:hypothetical protein
VNAESSPSPDANPVRNVAAWLVLIVVTVLGLASDLATKELAFARIANAPVEVRRDDVLAAWCHRRR